MISVLFPTYKGHRFIMKSLDAVIKQTYQKIEILIGFNGENEESKKIVSNFQDERIRIFDYGEEKGKAKTLNKLLKEARGEIIGVQDDDDIWLPQKLEKQLKEFPNYDIVGTFIEYIDENGGPWIENNFLRKGPKLHTNHREIIKGMLSGDNQIANTSALVKRECALEVGGWDENLDGVEDYDFWIKLTKNGKLFFNIPEVLTLHRIHSTSNFNSKKLSISIDDLLRKNMIINH